jgi:hypothetical protein
MQSYTPGMNNNSPYTTRPSPPRRDLGSACTTSEPSTPVKGLSLVEMKKIGREINSVAKVVEVVYMTGNALWEQTVETDQVLDPKGVIEKGVCNLRVLWVCS